MTSSPITIPALPPNHTLISIVATARVWQATVREEVSLDIYPHIDSYIKIARAATIPEAVTKAWLAGQRKTKSLDYYPEKVKNKGRPSDYTKGNSCKQLSPTSTISPSQSKSTSHQSSTENANAKNFHIGPRSS